MNKLWPALMIIVLLNIAMSCGKPEPPELERAAAFVKWFTAPKNLSKSMYSAAFPQGTPGQFVSYLFSDMGVAEWPNAASEMEQQQLRSAMIPTLPQDVALVPLQPNLNGKKQLVVKFDNEKGLILLEGYLDPRKPPVLYREITFRPVEPDPIAVEMYQGNAEMGMRDQSF